MKEYAKVSIEVCERTSGDKFSVVRHESSTFGKHSGCRDIGACLAFSLDVIGGRPMAALADAVCELVDNTDHDARPEEGEFIEAARRLMAFWKEHDNRG